MVFIRVRIPLYKSEYSALVRLAEKDFRNPENQIRYLIREAAIKSGVLPEGDSSLEPAYRSSQAHEERPVPPQSDDVKNSSEPGRIDINRPVPPPPDRG